MREVVVTGLGAVTSLGVGREPLWAGCLAGEQALAPIPERWHRFHKFSSTIWAPLPALDYEQLGFNRMELLQRDPVSLLAMKSAEEALVQAGYGLSRRDVRDNTCTVDDVAPERIGVYLGTGIGGSTSLCDDYVTHLLGGARRELGEHRERGPWLEDLAVEAGQSRRVNPFVVARTMPNSVAASISVKFGAKGPSLAVCQACASGTAAIGYAYRAVAAGEVDVAIAGGAEYFSDRLGGLAMSFDVAKTLVQNADPPERANRPFDKARSGFLISEGGAGCLILESAESACRRGATALARVEGFAETCDAYSLMSNADDREQARRMVTDTLAAADRRAGEVDYVNAHGTGTLTNDAPEAELLQEVFGTGALVNTTKAILGHSIGASGAIEAVVTVMSLLEQRVHGMPNLDDPVLPLAFARDSQAAPVEAALTYSFGFGGHNCALLMSRA